MSIVTSARAWTLALALLALLSSGCAVRKVQVPATNRPDVTSLKGRWLLARYRFMPRVEAAMPPLWIRFGADGGLEAFAGCQTLRGRYEIKGGALQIVFEPHIMRACPFIDEQTRFIRTIKGRHRILLDGALLRFGGKDWRAEFIKSGQSPKGAFAFSDSF